MKFIKFTPTGKLKEITITPPLVPEKTTWKEGDYVQAIPEEYVEKLLMGNTRMFSESKYNLPENFTLADLDNITCLNQLEEIGKRRFGKDLDKRKGAKKSRKILVDLLKAQRDQEEKEQLKE